MFKIFLFLFLTSCCTVNGQIFPAEGGKLNYRIIGFSFPQNGQGKFSLELAEGFYDNVDSFERHIIMSFRGKGNRIIGEVPSFGKNYTWRIVARQGADNLHHFSTLIVPDVDSNTTRLRILKAALTHSDDYVMLDASRTLYDMNGKPVWFLPVVDGAIADNFPSYGDIKLSPQHTITFITNRKSGHIYEVNYNGDILWKGPNTGAVNGDSIEYYNHEFTRLSNGNYMVMGGEFVWMPLSAKLDSFVIKHKEAKDKLKWDDNTKLFYERVQFGTLIEYDSTGKVIWSWKSSGYFKGSDVYKHKNMLGFYDVFDVHENSFYFDEKNSTIYISYRDISRIIKIKYPTGDILNVYGKLNDIGGPGYDNSWFYHQHSVTLTKEGYLSVYNNNNRRPGSLPTLVLMQEPISGKDTLKKVWEYQCTTDGIDPALKRVPDFAGLGNFMQLPDGSMLACMANDDYTRVFLLNMNKETLWSALPERWYPAIKKWTPILEYKACIISRKDLEQLIWNAQPGEIHD